MGYTLKDAKKILDHSLGAIFINFQKNLDQFNDYLNKTEKRLRIADPMRQLKLGYSITSTNGVVVRSIKQINRGAEIDIRVSDGSIKSQVNDITNK